MADTAGESQKAESRGQKAEGGDLAARARGLTLLALHRAHERYGDALMAEQEVVMRLADLVIETFVLQATLGRAQILSTRGDERAQQLSSLHAHEVTRTIERLASDVSAAVTDGSDTIRLKRRIARDLCGS